jgi:hypothetical protein
MLTMARHACSNLSRSARRRCLAGCHMRGAQSQRRPYDRARARPRVEGFGNIPNVLASFAVPYQIPFLLLISQRGELNEFNPAQVGMAHVVKPVLDALNIPHFTPLHVDQLKATIDGAARLAYGTDRPVAIVLSPYLTGGKKL